MGEVANRPVQEYDHTVAEANQVDQVDEKPTEPGYAAAELNAERIEYCATPSNGSHCPLIEVVKWAHMSVANLSQDVSSCLLALLYGYLREHRVRLVSLVALVALAGVQVGHVTDHEHLGEIKQVEGG